MSADSKSEADYAELEAQKDAEEQVLYTCVFWRDIQYVYSQTNRVVSEKNIWSVMDSENWYLQIRFFTVHIIALAYFISKTCF